MKHSLLDSAVPIFNTLHVLKKQGSSSETTSFGPMLRNMLQQFDRDAFEQHIPSHHVHDAKYALAALIDETMLKYASGENWITQLLQVELFGEHMAGEHFFKWLDRVKQQGAVYSPVLEVYYVCLKMGFSGRYAIEGPEKLNAIHADVKHTLDAYFGTPDTRLSTRLTLPQAIQLFKRQWPWWSYCAASGVGIAFFFVVYQLLVGGVIV